MHEINLKSKEVMCFLNVSNVYVVNLTFKLINLLLSFIELVVLFGFMTWCAYSFLFRQQHVGTLWLGLILEGNSSLAKVTVQAFLC